ncbi:hypothetical protein D3C72_2390220 [compost metagenome]
MNEYVGRAFVRLNEAEALGAVKPLYGASIHNDILSIVGFAGEIFVRLDRR